jgi:hypothetical protein
MLTSTRARRPAVWLVDDRKQNRDKFRSDHESEFDVETFPDPDNVLREIRDGKRPDALLCDIYFYEDEAQREEIERVVEKQVSELQKQAARFHPDQAQEGIALMASLGDQFGRNVPFPIFAFTSKGPYLLHTDSYNRIEELGARWLFKNKYSVQNERKEIRRAIEEFADRRDWRHRAWDVAWRTGLVMSIVGAILGLVADRVARHFGW